MRIRFVVMLSLLAILAVTFAAYRVDAQHGATPTPASGYGDLLDTEIRGLDSQTIEGYRTGLGLGMALPAELNGYPGPRHILDLADELELTADQRAGIQALFDDMQSQAIPLGEQILEKEAALELAFRGGTIDETSLEALLSEIGELQAELRFVHLRTHLTTINILTPHQVMLYNQMRGYGDGSGGQPHHP